jgi:uncharacterized membrane protein
VRYRQTLSAGDRHLTGRLESFGDIVVGFSISQLALQLEIPKTPHDVFGHPLRYFVYFAAFGIVAVFWFRFHGIMATGFAPEKLDVVLLFGFLACVGLVPFALVTYTRLLGAANVSREGFLLYLSVFFAVAALSWVLTVRGMRRAWVHLDEKERRMTWRAAVAGLVLVPLLAVAIVLDAFYGPRAAIVIAIFAPVVAIVTRRMRQPMRFLAGADVGVPAPQPASAQAS